MPIIIDPPSGLPVPRRTDKAPRSKRQGRSGPARVAMSAHRSTAVNHNELGELPLLTHSGRSDLESTI